MHIRVSSLGLMLSRRYPPPRRILHPMRLADRAAIRPSPATHARRQPWEAAPIRTAPDDAGTGPRISTGLAKRGLEEEAAAGVRHRLWDGHDGQRAAPVRRTFMLTVPAYEFLWCGHDEMNLHKRRHTAREVERKLLSAGFGRGNAATTTCSCSRRDWRANFTATYGTTRTVGRTSTKSHPGG